MRLYVTWFLIAMTGLIFAAACSADRAGGDVSKPANDALSGADEYMGDGGHQESDTRTPSGPVALNLVLDPEVANHELDKSIAVTAVGIDAMGKQVQVGALGKLTIAPPDVAQSHKVGHFKFLKSGEILLGACLAEQPDVCGNRTVICDTVGPKIEVFSPERASMLSGEPMVLVSGKVTDALGGVAAVQLNGKAVAVAEDGSFSGPATSGHALNLVDVTATDGFGNESRATRSYLYSTKYIAEGDADPAVALVDKALLAWLDDKLFYNDTPATGDSLTDLFSVILADLDIGALLPNPVVQDQDLSVLCLWDVYDIFINDITYAQPQVKLVPVAGGIALNIIIPDFSAAFAVETEGFACADYSGTVAATALLADAKIELSASASGDLLVNVTQTEVQFDNLQIKLGGIPGTLLNWLIDLFDSTIANLLQNEFNKQVEEMVSGLTDTLAETMAKPIEIPIDPFIPGNDPVALRLYVRFTKAAFSPAGADLVARVSVTAEHRIGRENPGSLARNNCLGGAGDQFAFDLGAPSPVELGGHFDLVNQALYSFWTNAGFRMHITSEALAEMGTDVSGYGVADLVMDLALLLPPVVTSCNAAEELTAQLGDVYLEASFVMFGIPADIDMYLFLELAADVAVVDGELGPEIGLTIDEPHYVIAEIASVNDEWLGKEDMLTGLITDTLVPMALKNLQDKPISFALPTLNLGGLLGGNGEPAEPGALDGKELVIALTKLSHDSGYVHAQGGIKVQDVPPPPEEEPSQ